MPYRSPRSLDSYMAEPCDDPSPNDAIHHAGHVELPGPAHGEPQAVAMVASTDEPTCTCAQWGFSRSVYEMAKAGNGHIPDCPLYLKPQSELPGPAHGEPQAVVTLAPADGPTPTRRPTLADLHNEIEHRKDRLIHFGDKLSEGERALIRRELDRMEPAFREVVRAYGQVWRTHGRCCQVFTYDPTRNAVNSVVAFAMDSLKAPEGAMP